MPITAAWMARHLDFALAHYPLTVTISGTAYPCAVGDQTRAVELDIAGFDADRGIEIMIKTSAITTVPAPGTKLTYNSLVYRIMTVARSSDGVHTIFSCQEENP